MAPGPVVVQARSFFDSRCVSPERNGAELVECTDAVRGGPCCCINLSGAVRAGSMALGRGGLGGYVIVWRKVGIVIAGAARGKEMTRDDRVGETIRCGISVLVYPRLAMQVGR